MTKMSVNEEGDLMNRRVKMILTVLIIACGFTACWDAEQNKATATGTKQNENSSVVMELSALSDQLMEIIQTTTVDLEGYDHQALQQLEKQIKDTKDQYDGIAGVSCFYTGSASQIVETVRIDLQQADLNLLGEKGILNMEGNSENGLSFAVSKKHLTALGFSFD